MTAIATSRVKNLIGRTKKNNRAARGARTLRQFRAATWNHHICSFPTLIRNHILHFYLNGAISMSHRSYTTPPRRNLLWFFVSSVKSYILNFRNSQEVCLFSQLLIVKQLSWKFAVIKWFDKGPNVKARTEHNKKEALDPGKGTEQQ